MSVCGVFSIRRQVHPAKLFPTPASCGEVRLEPAKIPAGCGFELTFLFPGSSFHFSVSY
jgi:hypothetical protein